MVPTPALTESERRWLHALLVLGTFVVGFLLVGLVANLFVYFFDVLLIFLLAWVFAFALSPLVAALERLLPTLPRPAAVVTVYVGLLFALLVVALSVAGSLATSIANFVRNIPDFQDRLPEILQPWQQRMDAVGLRIDLEAVARQLLAGLGSIGGNVVGPLTDLALASLGILGNLLLILFLSLFMVLDRDRIVAFIDRLVPPRYKDEARLFETSVSSSFGGFLRGQAIMGVIYGVIAAVGHLMFGLEYMPASAFTAAIAMAIPFFGPLFAWVPPVLVAVFLKPDAIIPVLAVMGVGWFVVMNVIQPRLMATAVGIHPIVVLASVIIGLKLAGIPGAIFGIPIAAVLSSFFFYYLNRTAAGGPRDVASRAARRLGERQRRHVRVPTSPPLPAVGPVPASAASADFAPGHGGVATEGARDERQTPFGDATLHEGRPAVDSTRVDLEPSS